MVLYGDMKNLIKGFKSWGYSQLFLFYYDYFFTKMKLIYIFNVNNINYENKY